MNKISVAGSTGFIGSRFCEFFPELVVKMQRDQREPETNEVLNFISTTNNYAFYNNIFVDINTNVNIMLEILNKGRMKFGSDFTFNQVSTWSVYGVTSLPAKENYPCNPLGFYSISKYTAEQLLISFCKIYGCKYRIFRLCNVIGETDRVIPKQKNALQFLINELKENRDISLYNKGNFLREFMYVEDVCDGLLHCIKKDKFNEIYNIGNGIKWVYREIIDYCKLALHSNSKIRLVDAPYANVSVQATDIYLDVTKLKNLGFKPKYTVYEALDIIMKHDYKEKGIINDNI